MSKVFDLDKIWAYLIVSSLGFFEPLGVLMLWFLIFVACDMVTGITASVKERKIITSHGLQRTVVKFLMYSMTIVLLHAIDSYMLIVANLGLAKIGATLICGIELYSILENCYRITGNMVFKTLTQFTLKGIEKHTGVKVKKVKTQSDDGDCFGSKAPRNDGKGKKKAVKK